MKQRQYKILIADDEELECQSMELFFSRAYPDLHLLESAKNGKDVVEKVLRYKPDILILDIEMPGLNGLEALRLLRQNDNDVHVIIKTAYSLFAYAHDAIQLKVDSYLLKPVKKAELSAAVDRVIDDLNKTETRNVGNDDLLLFAQSAFVTSVVRNYFSQDIIDQYAQLLNINFQSGFLLYASFVKNPNIVQYSTRWNGFIYELIEKSSVVAKIMPGNIDGYNMPVLVYTETYMNAEEYADISQFIKNLVGVLANEYFETECATTCGPLVSGNMIEINKSYADKIKAGTFERPANETRRLSKHLRKALTYINSNYADDISLNDLAEHLQLSPSYVSSLFKSELGKTFVDYLTDVRMLRAISLIKQGTVEVKELSTRVGYRYPSYFSKMFKQYTGYTVSDFKRLE